ncbi:MAG: outer membrane beta-barrel protein [Christiangramia sp.]
MPKNLVFCCILLFTLNSFSQRYRDYEVGPMLNYEHTSLYVANNVFNGADAEGFANSGFEPNFAAGVYGIYYFRPKMGLGAELYFQRTTSSELKEGEYYNSLTFMPYINFDPFRQIKNIYFGAGIGAAFIQESPDYGSSVKEEDVRVITIPLRISTSYRIRNQITFEVGAQAELLEVVNGQVRRNSIYAGIKVPFNRVFGRYR